MLNIMAISNQKPARQYSASYPGEYQLMHIEIFVDTKYRGMTDAQLWHLITSADSPAWHRWLSPLVLSQVHHLITSCFAGAVCAQPDSLAAWEFQDGLGDPVLHHRRPHPTLQLRRPQHGYLLPRHGPGAQPGQPLSAARGTLLCQEDRRILQRETNI